MHVVAFDFCRLAKFRFYFSTVIMAAFKMCEFLCSFVSSFQRIDGVGADGVTPGFSVHVLSFGHGAHCVFPLGALLHISAREDCCFVLCLTVVAMFLARIGIGGL